MKKLLFIVLMGMSAVATAQTITFADSNFRNALVNTLCVDTNGDSFSEDDVDINNDGLIQLSEALAVQRLNLLGSGIFSLKGIENFTNLLWLDCSHNTLDTLDLHALTNLEYLDCTESQITTINIQGLSNLQKLECPDNFISILNVQGLTSLQEINCTTNYITSLDVHGFNALTKLYCTNNQITTLNIIGLSSILELNCSQNLLTSINVQGLTTLQALYCGWNPISSLNVQGLTNLQTLWCSGNPISSLNVQGLTQLHRLYCDSTLISSLNLQGLNLLNILMCSNNNLSVLDLTGLANLEYLFCNNNHFTQLHFEGVPILQHLECNNNLLTTLNLQSLTLLSGLYCSNNQLTMLNINNTYFETYLEFDNNPNLVYVCCDTNEINQVQAKINSYGYINCAIGSYCSFTPGGTFYSIQGKNRIDFDNNGCNTLDPYWANLILSINNGSTIGNVISDTSGNYNLPLQAGNYIIKPIFENPSYFLYDSLMVSLPAGSNPFIYDFCIIPNGVHHDLEISMIPIIPARPGFDATYKIVYKNKGNIIESGYLTLGYSDSLIDFVNTSETPSAQAFGMLTWNFSNLMPMQTKEIMLTMNSNSPTENPALNVGDILSFDAVIVGGQPEETNADNSFGLMQTIVGSYDPNDKTCLEGNRITPSMVGNYIHYGGF
ncbi:MAG: T9SS C-terminal target domain-containing protein [Bacteroidota bacterium]